MSAIRGKDTKPELVVRRLLKAEGLRFSTHSRTLPGTPDIVLRRKRVAIFVNGCFWHGHSKCARARLPKSNPEFWKKKIHSNTLRDARVSGRLRRTGWSVFNIWQCNLRKPSSLNSLLNRLTSK